MSNENTPAAFPTPGRIELRPVQGKFGTSYEHKILSKDGMTLRDYFAGQVAASDAAQGDGWAAVTQDEALALARTYYAIADAMIAVRNEV